MTRQPPLPQLSERPQPSDTLCAQSVLMLLFSGLAPSQSRIEMLLDRIEDRPDLR